MQLVITLRKEVEDQAEGENLYWFIRQKLEDRPDITMTGHVTNHFIEENPEP